MLAAATSHRRCWWRCLRNATTVAVPEAAVVTEAAVVMEATVAVPEATVVTEVTAVESGTTSQESYFRAQSSRIQMAAKLVAAPGVKVVMEV